MCSYGCYKMGDFLIPFTFARRDIATPEEELAFKCRLVRGRITRHPAETHSGISRFMPPLRFTRVYASRYLLA